jgi:hypothetical protein
MIVVAAAHCLNNPGYTYTSQGFDPTNLYVAPPGVDLQSDDLAKRAKVLHVATPQGYNESSLANDVAFYFLDRPIVKDYLVSIANSGDVASLKKTGALITHLGYGGTSAEGLDANQPRIVTLKMDQASASRFGITSITEDQSISTLESPTQALCKSDAGGPSFAAINGKESLIAINVKGSGCSSSPVDAKSSGTLDLEVFYYTKLLNSEWSTYSQKFVGNADVENSSKELLKIMIAQGLVRDPAKPAPSPAPKNWGVPATTASIITRRPVDMRGINTQTKLFSGQADPDLVTLGKKFGVVPSVPYYKGKRGTEVEVPRGTPLLAPLDSNFVGFNTSLTASNVTSDGNLARPFDSLELCFQSTSSQWPNLIYCTYHISNSPLLHGYNVNKYCSDNVEPPGKMVVQGHLYYSTNDGINPGQGSASLCEALMGKAIKRGQVIGYARAVGPHNFASFIFKVPDKKVNLTVTSGNPYLHWVQPSNFFYWKCYGTKTTFPPGVMAYPFPCGGYKVSAKEASSKFKYLQKS